MCVCWSEIVSRYVVGMIVFWMTWLTWLVVRGGLEEKMAGCGMTGG
jgi:hypothetical protein